VAATVRAAPEPAAPALPPHPPLPPAPTTKEEWNRYVDTEANVAPPLHALADYRRLSSAERLAYDEARLVHHGAFAPVSTPWMRDVHARLARQMAANLRNRQPGARRGSVISANANRGKTTIGMTFAKHYQRSVFARYGRRTPDGNRLIPVVYVTLPDDCRTKWLDLAICEFYAVPLPGRPTKDDLVRAIQRVARLTMTTLFIVDDIHYLNLATREGQAVNDHLKYLANTVAATFVYAGIDCELTGLMTEGFSPSTHSSSQTKSRFSLLDVGSFDDRTPEGRARWRSLLASFEPELVLLGARPADVSKSLAPYLYWRTAGVIGSISTLLREGAALAIERGAERLSESLLDEVEVDADADGQAARRKRPSPSTLAPQPS
jgi:hypothetical protein